SWAGRQAKLVDAQQRMARRDQIVGTLVSAIGRLTALLVLGVGALRVMDGHLSLGGLVAFQALMAGFIGPIESLTSFGLTLQELRGNLERLDDVLGHEPEAIPAGAAPPPGLSGGAGRGGALSGPLPSSPPLVDRFDLRIVPGQRVAVVGASGSGKSTIAKLVSALYRPWAGEIHFDGQPRDRL